MRRQGKSSCTCIAFLCLSFSHLNIIWYFSKMTNRYFFQLTPNSDRGPSYKEIWPTRHRFLDAATSGFSIIPLIGTPSAICVSRSGLTAPVTRLRTNVRMSLLKYVCNKNIMKNQKILHSFGCSYKPGFTQAGHFHMYWILKEFLRSTHLHPQQLLDCCRFTRDT